MEKKVEIMPRMRDLKKGKKVEFLSIKSAQCATMFHCLMHKGTKMDISGDRKLMFRKG